MENSQKKQKDTKPVIDPLDSTKLRPIKNSASAVSTMVLIVLVAVVVLGGVATGYALGTSGAGITSIKSTGEQLVKGEKAFGKLEEGVDYDEAEGLLKAGGIEGEGTHHLERDGGPARYVYITSFSVNLDEFIDKEVKVWGITHSAEKAGWFMEVTKVEVK